MIQVDRTTVIGIVLGLLSGVTLGGITSFAALSYDHGATPIGLVFFRAIIAFVVMLGCAVYNQEHLWPGKQALGHSLLTGLALSLIGFGYMAAVAFITPGLAVAILYLFPLMVLAVESIGQRRMPPAATILAFGIALGGIIMCLGQTFTSLDWRGMTLGIIAAMGMGGYLLASSRLRRAGFGYMPLIWANVLVMFLAVGLSFLFGGSSQLMLPDSSLGLSAMLAAAALYSIGLLLSFIALRFVSAAVVALMMHIEPVTTLIAAWLIVSEDLTTLQYLGMVIAIVGITLGGIQKPQKKSFE